MKNKFATLTLASLLIFASCSENEKDNLGPEVEVVDKSTNLLIVNRDQNNELANCEMTQIYIGEDTVINNEVYFAKNGEYPLKTLNFATESSEKIYITNNPNRSGRSHIEILDKKTLVSEAIIALDTCFLPVAATALPADGFVVTGTTVPYIIVDGSALVKQTSTMFVYEGSNGNYTPRAIDLNGAKAYHSQVIGEKLFVIAGPQSGESLDQLLVFDIDNINSGAYRVVATDVRTPNSINRNILVDSSGTAWIVAVKESAPYSYNYETTLYKLDPNAEQITSTTSLYGISNADPLGVDILDNTLYIRAKEALYGIDLTNPQNPLNPTYNIEGQFSELWDLEITAAGNITTIVNINSNGGDKGYLYELTPAKSGEEWAEPKIFEIAPSSNIIMNLN